MPKLETHIPDFYDNLLDGYYYKEIVRTILDLSNYIVFPYGFESTFSYIKIQLHKKKINESDTVKRIRSSPDLLVYDDEKRKLWLVEVKSRNYDDEASIIIDKIPWYLKYWRDSILVVIIPHGHWFYAQRVWKLKAKDEYNLREEFKTFEHFFPNVDIDTLYRFKFDVAGKMKREIDSAYYFPERDDKFFVPELIGLVNENQGKTGDQLFKVYNRERLVSTGLFSAKLKELVQAGKLREAQNKLYC